MNPTKTDLEIQKLKAEIRQIKRWYVAPAFWSFLIALMAFIATLRSGLLDARAARIELQTERLRDTLQHYTRIRDRYEQFAQKAYAYTMQMSKTNNQLLDSIRTGKRIIQQLDSAYTRLENDTRGVDVNLKRITKDYLVLQNRMQDSLRFYNFKVESAQEAAHGVLSEARYDLQSVAHYAEECTKIKDSLQRENIILKSRLGIQ